MHVLSVCYLFLPVLLNAQNPKPSEAHTISTQEFFDDMKKYDTSKHDCHWGNVYQHNVWVARSIALFFDNPDSRPDFSQWTEGINRRYKQLLIVTGFLHDIGKAGDLIYNFTTKSNHPKIGCDYLMGIKSYRLSPEKAFDIRTWVKKLGISDNDIKLMAILIRMHHEFGSLFSNAENTSGYLESLQTYFHEANFNENRITEEFLKMSILLTAADVYGLSPVDATPSMGAGFPQWQETIIPTHPTDGYAIKYNDWRYAIAGLELRAKLVQKFRKFHALESHEPPVSVKYSVQGGEFITRCQETHSPEQNKLETLKDSLIQLKTNLNLLTQQLQILKERG